MCSNYLPKSILAGTVMLSSTAVPAMAQWLNYQPETDRAGYLPTA